ncbi:PREDICTED: fibrous sheath CABYR-binding protein-like isoform X2 [Cyprinodon variegatus]|uniref:fibrous sheath CABYR-binding protein-like isoform X2 n=1 Tax=Cyprinodon variegatus TaxID=28743 RepID=UPI000742A259|nr:PREDICTED: fibrous sheath CABYR-binding protein-like isoform X2 [Cyprinodon variegatus]
MPSKRKKNKRRMRRVQAQRRALEEQHAANPPIKTSSGTAVRPPPITNLKKAAKPTAKTAPPNRENLPQAVPISIPLVEPQKEEPEPVEKEDTADVHDEIATVESGGVLLEQASCELDVESRVGDEVVDPAHVGKDGPVESSPPVKPSTVEDDLAQEAESSVSESEAVFEVAAPEEAPAEVASEAETYEICEADSEKAETLAEEDAEAKLELEGAITEEVSISESAKEAAEDREIEDLTSDKSPAEDTGSVEEAVIETVEAENGVEVGPLEPPEEGEEKVEDVAEEDLAALSVEPVTAAEDVPVSSLEIPTVLNAITESPMEEADLPFVEAKEEAADLPVHESVVTESVSAVNDAVSSSPLVQLETERTGDTFTTQIESSDSATAAAAHAEAPDAPTEENAADQSCLDVLTDEVKSGDFPCQIQIPVEAKQLNAVELSVEIAQNGNIVPEVPIEG